MTSSPDTEGLVLQWTPNDNALILSYAAREPGLLGARCDSAADDDESWPTPVGDGMLVFDIADGPGHPTVTVAGRVDWVR